MKNSILLITLFAFVVTGCYKSKIAEDTPDCVIERIKEIRKNDCALEGTSVREYLFQNKTVYAVHSVSCFMENPTTIYDIECGYLGYFAMNSWDAISRDDFLSATFIRVIWEK
ncbi:MAG: hypothetical protein ACJASQ_003763 [Crocinitomicaceae bacterium]|jgi:hypothetical protein